jgi:two-component system sensor histidine kinase CiaH
MDRSWKQSAASGTASAHNVFLKARLKLTGLYILIVALIVFGFSVFLYQSIGRNLKDVQDEDFAGPQFHQHFIQSTLLTVENDLLLADLVIILAAAGISFILAGETLKPIQRSVEAQKAFAANASHELRTPLAVMRNDIEVFQRNAAQSPKLADATMTSNLEEIRRMSGIVEDLLLLARSDHQVSADYADIDLGVLAEHTVRRMKPLADSRKISLSFEGSGPAKVRGSEPALERAILNILQNAIDHTSEGGAVNAKIAKAGNHAILRIGDTGSGIAEKDLPHIFKRFYKGESAKGTGLGLSIVKDIVEQHRGMVSFESVLGKGTTAIISVPLA